MQSIDDEILDDKKTAARILRVAPDTLDRWDRKGVGPKRIKLPGGQVRYSRRDLVAFIRASVTNGGGAAEQANPKALATLPTPARELKV